MSNNIYLLVIILVLIIMFFMIFISLKKNDKKIKNTYVFKINNRNFHIIYLNKQYRLSIESNESYPSIKAEVNYLGKIYNFPDGTEIMPNCNSDAYNIKKAVLSFLEFEEINLRREKFEKEMFEETFLLGEVNKNDN